MEDCVAKHSPACAASATKNFTYPAMERRALRPSRAAPSAALCRAARKLDPPSGHGGGGGGSSASRPLKLVVLGGSLTAGQMLSCSDVKGVGSGTPCAWPRRLGDALAAAARGRNQTLDLSILNLAKGGTTTVGYELGRVCAT